MCTHRAFPSFLFFSFSFFCCIFCHVPFLLEQGDPRTAKEDAELAESLLKPLLPAMDDSGSYTAIGTAITGMKGGGAYFDREQLMGEDVLE